MADQIDDQLLDFGIKTQRAQLMSLIIDILASSNLALIDFLQLTHHCQNRQFVHRTG